MNYESPHPILTALHKFQIKEGDSAGAGQGDPVARGRLQEGGPPLQVREIHPARRGKNI